MWFPSRTRSINPSISVSLSKNLSPSTQFAPAFLSCFFIPEAYHANNNVGNNTVGNFADQCEHPHPAPIPSTIPPASHTHPQPTRPGLTLAEDFLVATDLRKSFDDIQAVDGVSFTIRRQEIYGLLGPNGAGKTTTIRMLSTVVSPDVGEISIGGHSAQREGDQVRKIIGVCPQDLALYPELSATDNLTFFGKMAGLSGREADEQSRVNLELVGLSDRAKDRVDKFSGGMKRRVNLAIALMSRPALLFLDEPTVGIDPQSRNHIFETILGLRAEGQTILYTTHYMEEADRLCDRIGIIDNGRVIAEGSPAELKSRIGSPDEVTLEEVFLNLTGRSLRD